MEVSDFKELLIYNHTVRQNYIDAFKKNLSWEDVTKNRETGWLSLKDTLSHIIWVEDSWINYSIQGLEILIGHFLILNTTHGMQLMTITLLPHQRSIIICHRLHQMIYGDQFQE